jgi:hypothetical protein
MRVRVGLLATLVVLVAGCGSAGFHRGQAYRLYTHCGVEWARIDGVFWRAVQPLSDGSGNPPPGWGNPFQEGRLTLTNPTTAEFSSPAGSVTFKRTGRTRAPVICS